MTTEQLATTAADACRRAFMISAAYEIAKSAGNLRRLIPAIERARADIPRRARRHPIARPLLIVAERELYRAHQAALDDYRRPPCANSK